MNGLNAATLDEYVASVAQILHDWSATEARIWFRGHGDTAWPLRPSIYREEHDLKDAEDALRRDFILRAGPYLDGAVREPRTDWDWYFHMQHYGLPTRLLDWTESALIALYFAIRDHQGTKTPAAVWVLDPWVLNEALSGATIIMDPENEAKDYLHEPYGDSSGMPGPPVAIRARHTSRRIAAQRGVFTVHGREDRALETYDRLDNALAKIEIAGKNVPRIRKYLAIAGITDAVVFPELPGICREVLDYWRRSRESAT